MIVVGTGNASAVAAPASSNSTAIRVDSSMNSGTPSARASIRCTNSFGSRVSPQAPCTRVRDSSGDRPRSSVSWMGERGCHCGSGSVREVTTIRSGDVRAPLASRFNNSAVDGSTQ